MKPSIIIYKEKQFSEQLALCLYMPSFTFKMDFLISKTFGTHINNSSKLS